jgi:hypothetical protein
MSGSDVLTRDETGGILLSLDGRDIRESKSLLCMPTQAGKLMVKTRAGWDQPMLETGEIQDGRWTTFANAGLRADDIALTITVSPEQVYSLLLVTEQGKTDQSRRAVELAFTAPAQLP